jgi:hypothetical protein
MTILNPKCSLVMFVTEFNAEISSQSLAHLREMYPCLGRVFAAARG